MRASTGWRPPGLGFCFPRDCGCPRSVSHVLGGRPADLGLLASRGIAVVLAVSRPFWGGLRRNAGCDGVTIQAGRFCIAYYILEHLLRAYGAGQTAAPRSVHLLAAAHQAERRRDTVLYPSPPPLLVSDGGQIGEPESRS